MRLQVCLFFGFLAGAAPNSLPNPLCPDQKGVYSGSTSSDKDFCMTIVNKTFDKRKNENWAQHFAKECEKLFMEPTIESWAFTKYPLETGLKQLHERFFYSALSVYLPSVTLINGVYYTLKSRSPEIVEFTINDPTTKSDIAYCSYTYNKSISNWEEAKDEPDDCKFLKANRWKVGTISPSWQQFCLQIKLKKAVYTHPNFFYYSMEHFDFFNCFDNRDAHLMAALCRHEGLKHCHDLTFKNGCKSCEDGWDGPICTYHKDQPCKRYPCGSYGTCTHLGGEKFTCQCEEKHSGKYCEIKPKLCDSKPCQNNALCVETDDLEYLCYCQHGFYGKNCENDMNECEKIKCLNGGSCQNTHKGYGCVCPPGFTGKLCGSVEQKSELSQHCPAKAGPYGGETSDGKKCISRAVYTFTKHHDANWVVHFEKECKKQYATTVLYTWLPKNPLTPAVPLGDEPNLPFSEILLNTSMLLNGLHFEITEKEQNTIKANAFIGSEKKPAAKCTFQQDLSGIWHSYSEDGISELCDFHESTLQDFEFSNSDMNILCLYLKIPNNVGISENSDWVKNNTHIFDCIHDGEDLNPIALCVHEPSKHCMDFEINVGCKKCSEKHIEGPFCTIDTTDPCNKIPCGSYGTCKRLNRNNHECICELGSFGSSCEYAKNRCEEKPCQNNGTCHSVGRTYTCDCAVGYTGSDCRRDINECLNEVCKNGGTCVNVFGSYICNCPDGFEGKNCETDKDDCSPNPCMNDGTCSDLIQDFRCRCKSGYTGKICDMDVNECESNPCKNGGTCENRENAYLCTCMPGFTGVQCNGVTAFCDTYTCLNGGTCEILNDDTKCTCHKNFTGNRCETEVILCTEKICGPGTCIQREIDFECNCSQTGFEGSRCQRKIDQCLSDPCGSNAICIDEIKGYRCICKSDFAGPGCKEVKNPCIIENPCRNGGSCSWEEEELKCICPRDLTGKYCTELNGVPPVQSAHTRQKNNIWLIVIPMASGMIVMMILSILILLRRRSSKHRYRKHRMSIPQRLKSMATAWGSLSERGQQNSEIESQKSGSKMAAKSEKNSSNKFNNYVLPSESQIKASSKKSKASNIHRSKSQASYKR